MQMDKLLVDMQMSIIDIISRINENAKGIVYVVEEQKLIGVITDGDIRRHILKKGTLDGTARDVMNSHPFYLNVENVDNKQSIMKEKKINSIPVVDNHMNILQIEFDDGARYYEGSTLDVPVVIMAGGKGTRLYPYTQVLPKPLIPVGERTITEHIIGRFQNFGCTDFTMIINYKKEFIKAFFAESEAFGNMKFVEEKEFLGTAGGLKFLTGRIDKTFFMTNCDILIEGNYVDMYKYHKQRKNVITLVCALKKEVIPYGAVTTDEEGAIKSLTEKPAFEFLANTGLYIIEPEFLNEIPDNTFIHITDVIQSCMDKGMNVGVYPINENSWMDMGQLEELEKMRKRLAD